MIGIAILVLQVAALSPPGAATVSGVVRDTYRGSPIADAVVSLSDVGLSAVTGPSGRYRLDGVPAGPQHLGIRRVGYAERTLHLMVPTSGTIEVDIGLEPEPLAIRPMRVEARVATIPPDTTDPLPAPDVLVTRGSAWGNALSAEPDFVAALLGGGVTASPESPAGLNVRGGSTDQVAYLLNGIPVFSPFHAEGVFSAWSPDALSTVELRTTSRPLWSPDALAGAVLAQTLPPSDRLTVSGAVSTNQARVMGSGPVRPLGGGVLLGGRLGFPGTVKPDPDPGYVHGGGSDWVATFERPASGGVLRLLFYRNDNSFKTAGEASVDDSSSVSPSAPSPRNRFGWEGTSLGGEYVLPLGTRRRVVSRVWRAGANASVDWSTGLTLRSLRTDQGAMALVEDAGPGGARTVGLEARRSRTLYRTVSPGADGVLLDMGTLNTILAGFVDERRPIGSAVTVDLGLRGTLLGSGIRLAPRAGIQWSPLEEATISGSLARSYQFEQSLRNDQSIFANIFPADLFVGADGGRTPVARADQAALSAVVRPGAGNVVRLEAYRRRSADLVLAAPGTVLPFTRDGFRLGASSVRGMSVEATRSASRYEATATYGRQEATYSYGDSTYTPDFVGAHSVDLGISAHPTATFSLRLGLIGVFGRHATAVGGPFTWQTCSLGDGGCQIEGSPDWRPESLGATRLPAYVRVDVGVRKHWDVVVARRRALLAVYGSFTNLLGRANVLTFIEDRASGLREPLPMRGRSPLAVGLEWRF
jgi:hypothetical protein